ncbi:MAG: UDP-N-acetylglucosamine--N-acetylmuramyl-(pentapeptide) pyrophosphoryl-undecaprenol N-acetylglucosamine transferase [Solirubrobacteraceae bacterium]|nr:UDP-N-acetylglucosamine--N-acetylmuramyl-(pentapeptide) pyrophosphoryl-undecaprenol N-acetylglucosamine transferase [Solirubrobacteraceae bacterium]
MVPALAVADALRADGHAVAFIGGDREEARLVPEAGYELHRLRAQGLSRTNPLKAARAAGMAGRAVCRARRLLRDLAPDAVMGGGGYVAGVVGAAAAGRRIPLVLTEADSHLGVSNRLLHRRAARVCLGFPIEGRTEPTFRVTGRPVPPPDRDRTAARAAFGLPDGAPTVLVFGGSLGARSVNEAAVDGLADLAVDGRAVAVLHATGRRDHADLVARYPERAASAPGPDHPGDAPGPYRLYDYLAPLSRALAACDLVVARSGGSIAEVTAHGRPAVLVPYPHAAADHQTANARWMEREGAAIVIPDDALDAGGLRDAVVGLLGDRERLDAMAAASARLARPDAARAIADEVVAAAR